MRFNRSALWLIALLMAIVLAFSGCDLLEISDGDDFAPTKKSETSYSEIDASAQRDAEKALGVAAFSGTPYAELNGNKPTFTTEEITAKSYEFYSELDKLGRCGYTMACIGKDIMPIEDRGDISSVKPSGWVNKKYDSDLVDGGYIYNRCHLIGFQLTGENANKNNLITGTRYMNVDGMLPFENMVADYIKETDNHVMYRVTPVYDGNDLVACGVKLEAYSVEDKGEGISFNVYVYNVQPGIVIDYATGNNWLLSEAPQETEPVETDEIDEETGEKKYVLNTNTKTIHDPSCSSATSMSVANKREHTGDIQGLLTEGYKPCGKCKPTS